MLAAPVNGGRWTDWFEGLTITPEGNGDTLLTGPVVDQAALHGLLRRVRDLGLPLLSVMHVEAEQAQEANTRFPPRRPQSSKETNTCVPTRSLPASSSPQ